MKCFTKLELIDFSKKQVENKNCFELMFYLYGGVYVIFGKKNKTNYK